MHDSQTNPEQPANSEQSGLRRRTIVKGAAWSLPVIAVAAASPLAAASTACTEPAASAGVGTWWINGPKDSAAGYIGWQPNNEPDSRRYYYNEGSALAFSWNWTSAGDATGAIPVGTRFRIGIGGEATLDDFWIESFPVPVVSTPSIQYTGSTGPKGNWYIFQVVAPIAPGTLVTWTSTITLKSTYPDELHVAHTFGAYASIGSFTDTTNCPPLTVAPSSAAEWSNASSTSSLATYAITNQYIKDNPDYLQ